VTLIDLNFLKARSHAVLAGGGMNRKEEKLIKRTLAKNHACYVLITCDEPTEDGSMQVEMTYEGDADVAAYLLQGAQNFMDEQDIEKPVSSSNKIHKVNF